MQGRAGSQLCFPALVLHPLPMSLASSSAAGCAACSSLSALRPLPGTSRQCRCPPLAWGVQTHLLGLRGTTKVYHQPWSSLQTLHAMDIMLHTLVLSIPASRLSKELQHILQVWSKQSVGLAGAVLQRAGKRVSTGSPHSSAMHRPPCREGSHLHWLSQGLPNGLF